MDRRRRKMEQHTPLSDILLIQQARTPRNRIGARSVGSQEYAGNAKQQPNTATFLY